VNDVIVRAFEFYSNTWHSICLENLTKTYSQSCNADNDVPAPHMTLIFDGILGFIKYTAVGLFPASNKKNLLTTELHWQLCFQPVLFDCKLALHRASRLICLYSTCSHAFKSYATQILSIYPLGRTATITSFVKKLSFTASSESLPMIRQFAHSIT